MIKKANSCQLVALILLSVALRSNAQLYVSPAGDDNNKGSLSSPLRTVSAALKQSRSVTNRPQKEIILRQGTYSVASPVTIDKRDVDLVIKSFLNESVTITTGTIIQADELTPVTDPGVLKRLPDNARSLIKQFDLGKWDIELSEWPAAFKGHAGWPLLFFGTTPLRLARWPNAGYAIMKDVLDSGSGYAPGRPVSLRKKQEKRGGTFVYEEENPSQWDMSEDIYLGGYWHVKWYDQFIKVKAIDTKAQTITLAAPHIYGLRANKHWDTRGFFAINLLEELDLPGEYVVDRARNQIYIIPPIGFQNDSLLHASARKTPVLKIDGAKRISFQNITFSGSCSDGVLVKEAEDIVFENCVLCEFAGGGAVVSGGKRCGFTNCHIYNIGKKGIGLSGGERSTLNPSGHFVKNSHLHHYSLLTKTYNPAVLLKGVGQEVSNNYIHDSPHAAILFAGNDHLIAYNHIERVCLDTADAGAIYCGRDWTMGGNSITGNFLNDLGHSSKEDHPTWAIYLDDMASGIEVKNNIIKDSSGIHIGGGRNNRIQSNLVVNPTRYSIRFDSRGTAWANKSRDWLNYPNGIMWKRLAEIPIKNEPWKSRFPYLLSLEANTGGEPRDNIVVDNVTSGEPAIDIAQNVITYSTVKNNRIVEGADAILRGDKLKVMPETLSHLSSMHIGPKH